LFDLLLPRIHRPDLEVPTLTDQHHLLVERREAAQFRRDQQPPGGVDLDILCMTDQQTLQQARLTLQARKTHDAFANGFPLRTRIHQQTTMRMGRHDQSAFGLDEQDWMPHCAGSFKLGIRFENCVFDENVAATAGGGIMSESDLQSVHSTWGAGSSDNTPDDVGLVDAGTTTTFEGFGRAENFACEVGAATCLDR